MGFLGKIAGVNNDTMGLPPGVQPANYSMALTDAMALMNNASPFAQADQSRAQQQDFINSLKNRTGPSAAELQQQQALQASQKNMAGAMASARGINPAMAARLASQANSAQSAQIAGQGALLRAQEEAQNQSALAQAIQGMRTQDIGQTTNLMSNINQRVGILGGLMGQQQAIGAGAAQQNAGFGQGVLGGLIGGASQAGAMAMGKPAAYGGQVSKLAYGGSAEESMSAADHFISAVNSRAQQMAQANQAAGAQSIQSGVAGFGGIKSKPQTAAVDIGGAAPDMIQQTPQVMPVAPGMSEQMTSRAPGKMDLQIAGGGFVPGKAQVKGDSEKNDVVHALLSPGEVVLPRTIAKNPEKAKKFVAALLEEKSGKEATKEVNGDGKLSHGGKICMNCGGIVKKMAKGGYSFPSDMGESRAYVCKNETCNSYGDYHPNCKCF